MEIDLFSSFKNHALEKGIIFYYSGRISQNVIATMSDVLKHRFENSENPSSTRKVFSSFIEMIQNALHYSPHALDGNPEKIGAIAVGKSNGQYFIICGNVVGREFVSRISEKIDLVNSMSKEEVKAAYKAQLRNEELSDDEISKGAGLGLLTIARDSVLPIEYHFKPIVEHGNQYSELHLKTMF
jgi:hypothetical protein